jgi:hypothetical protein
MRVDVIGLLQRMATVADIHADLMFRSGARLVLRWCRLNVLIDPQFRYQGRGKWLPGISVWGNDPEGRFGQSDFFLFDDVTLSAIDLPRVEAFLTRFDEARKHYAVKRNSPSRKSDRYRRTTS